MHLMDKLITHKKEAIIKSMFSFIWWLDLYLQVQNNLTYVFILFKKFCENILLSKFVRHIGHYLYKKNKIKFQKVFCNNEIIRTNNVIDEKRAFG